MVNLGIVALCVTGLCLLASPGDSVAPPGFRADSAKIVFASHRDGNWEIYVADADGANQTRVTRRGGHTRFPLWSPDRSRIGFVTMVGEPENGWELWTMSAAGTHARRLCTGVIAKSGRAWSPDGRRIALTASADGNVDIYVAGDGPGKPARLTNSPAVDRDPSWSPDGASIAFSSERDGNREVYVMRADGSGLRRVTNHPAMDASPVWSPDGSLIAFVSGRDGTQELYVVTADGTRLEKLTTGAHASRDMPRWSPDGSHIVFQIANDGRYDIGIVRVRDRKQRVLVSTPHSDGSFTWSADGAQLAYISGRSTAETLHVVDVASGHTRPLTTTWSLTPDWAR